jgi:hypothetical protein
MQHEIERTRRQLDAKGEGREKAAADLFESLTKTELITLQQLIERVTKEFYWINTTPTKLFAEIVGLGYVKVGQLVHDRVKFREEFGQ